MQLLVILFLMKLLLESNYSNLVRVAGITVMELKQPSERC